MPDVLRNVGATKDVTSSLRTAALLSLILVLPFAVLESLNQTMTKQSAPGLLALFGLLWLLPTAFIFTLMPLVRASRAGNLVTANPFGLLFRVALLALIAAVWVSITVDQTPCFMGAPNCD